MPKAMSPTASKSRNTFVPTLLVVDDEPAMLEMFRDVVASDISCKLHVAKTMAEARRMMARLPVDVMIADVKLPDGDGMELLAELKLTSPNAGAVFITGAPSVEQTVYAMRHGALDYLPKPFSAEQICQHVKVAIHKQQLAARNERRLHKLKTAVRELNKARRTVSQKVDLLCNDLVSAYGEVSAQMQTLRVQESFRRTIEQAKDLEQLLCHAMDWLLKEAGYSNIAIWLCGQEGDRFELGAYMKYTVVGEKRVTTALQKALVQPTVREGFLHLSDSELSHLLPAADKKLFPPQTVMSASCTYLGESLAVVAMFRDGKCPFRDEDVSMLKAIATVFATQLASAVRGGAQERGEYEPADDITDTPWMDEPDTDKKPRNQKEKEQYDADWWKRGEPPPF